MELRVLRYFLAVVKEESFSAAATSLHLTQPTLSRQIKELEDELGVTLLLRSRNNKTITLTKDGLFLKKKAEELLELADKTTSEFLQKKDFVSGDIHIGAGELDSMHILAKLAAKLHSSYPDIRYHLHSGTADFISERLDEGIFDFGILVGSPNITKYNYLKLSQTAKWQVLMRKDDPLAKKTSIVPKDINTKPLILSSQSIETNELTGWLKKDKQSLNIIATYNLVYNATFFVEEGLGYALVLKGIVMHSAKSKLCTIPLSPKLESNIYLVWKKNTQFSEATELFLQQLQQ